MRTIITTAVLSALSLSAAYSASTTPDQQASLKATFSPMPLSFTENQGQWPDSILYRASAGGATMWFTSTGVYYQFTRPILKQSDQSGALSVDEHLYSKFKAEPDSFETTMIRAEFVGVQLSPATEGIDLMDYKCNYFLGNEPDKWRTNVSNYESIRYREVYSGIDLKYYGNGRQMEYDFIVSPGADYSKIQIRYYGAESLTPGENGELIIKVANGEIIEQPPVVYQIIRGRKVNINCNYVITGDNTFSFRVDGRYNPAHELVIDPALVYSTYLGGSSNDACRDISVDVDGAAYVSGYTTSSSFPTLDPYQGTIQGNRDAFITKLNSDGSNLIYSTFLGGSDVEYCYGIEVDAAGAMYVTGWTFSDDFPTRNSLQTKQLYEDVFVTKLSSNGDSLLYSTYLGGNWREHGYGIAIDTAGSAYITGWTGSSDFPTLNPIQTDQGDNDVFVTKLSNDGNLVYSTYLGGVFSDICYDIAVDAGGAAYISGHTRSPDFPTVNPYQTNQVGGDIFVTKLSGDGNSIVYSTYLGGSDGRQTFSSGIAVDAAGAAYVVGYTLSQDFPTFNPYQTDQGGWDVFVTKLSSAGNSLIYSTYLAGSGDDFGGDISVDSAGAVCITGQTYSSNFPTLNPYQTYQGTTVYSDAFVTKLSSGGNNLVYSTYLGGSTQDFGIAITLDATGAALVTGKTYSDNFPTLNPYQGTHQGELYAYDVFVAKLAVCCAGNRGDVNSDGSDADISDLTFIVDRVFRGGPLAICPEEADVNGDGTPSNILDLTFLVDLIFRNGPLPGAC